MSRKFDAIGMVSRQRCTPPRTLGSCTRRQLNDLPCRRRTRRKYFSPVVSVAPASRATVKKAQEIQAVNSVLSNRNGVCKPPKQEYGRTIDAGTQGGSTGVPRIRPAAAGSLPDWSPTRHENAAGMPVALIVDDDLGARTGL